MTYIRFFFVLYWFALFLNFGSLPSENPRCAPEWTINITCGSFVFIFIIFAITILVNHQPRHASQIIWKEVHLLVPSQNWVSSTTQKSTIQIPRMLQKNSTVLIEKKDDQSPCVSYMQIANCKLNTSSCLSLYFLLIA